MHLGVHSGSLSGCAPGLVRSRLVGVPHAAREEQRCACGEQRPAPIASVGAKPSAPVVASPPPGAGGVVAVAVGVGVQMGLVVGTGNTVAVVVGVGVMVGVGVAVSVGVTEGVGVTMTGLTVMVTVATSLSSAPSFRGEREARPLPRTLPRA